MNIPYYPTVTSDIHFPTLEQEVLDFWQAQNVFDASVAARPAQQSGQSNAYVFYDGPPFANGLPHHGHLLTGYVKDAVARYQTMRGKRVERRFGWDCHGLPAEMEAEKQLGVSGRQHIIQFGIEKFNAHCRTSVMQYRNEWEAYVNRQARWVDFANDYKTMDTDYMESVLWAFAQLYKKGLIYEGFKVMPYSWAAETVLSTSEIRLDDATREKIDKAVEVAFTLNDHKLNNIPADATVHVVAWTTTPWTLPSNLALAASGELHYAATYDKSAKAYFIQQHHTSAESDEGKLLPIKGSELIGSSYTPLFPYFVDHPNAFRILDGSDFIEAGAGTGIVHMAPGFGEDDQRVCADNGIHVVVPVDGEGRYTDAIYDMPDLHLKGLNVIRETRHKLESEPYTDAQLTKYGLANLRIITWLKAHGHLVKQEDYAHNYPHCWRTDQPIIYKAMSSWFVDVPKIRDRMVELNQEINWIPNHVKDGRFGKWLENAREWSISRSRFWGCPLPVWRSDNPDNTQLYVFGSTQELEDFFGVTVDDLHKPFIDTLTKPDPENPDYTLQRVDEVFDCWFESGSMPYAQVHYPFENKDWFEQHFPADFIVEYEAQTRGWFYNMVVLSVALFDRIPFKNCICHGVVLDGEGRKLSKKLKNYVDPNELFDLYGSDALRWFMLSSTIMRGNELFLDAEGAFIRDAVRLYIKPLWNAYHFFCLYANADKLKAAISIDSDNLMDRYILAKLQHCTDAVRDAMDAYDTPTACHAITAFLEVLNNWYIRRNRNRFWSDDTGADKQHAYNTLYTVLHVMCRITAPLLPQVTEAMYAGLTHNGTYEAKRSVHLADYPSDLDALQPDASLMQAMDRVQDICNTAHAIRNDIGTRIRQPLATLTVYGADIRAHQAYFQRLIADETNVKSVIFSDDLDGAATKQLKINFPIVGKRLKTKMKAITIAAKSGQWSFTPNGHVAIAEETLTPDEFEFTLVSTIAQGAAALAAQDGLVVLDTHLTPELIQEGLARDVVRLIQQSRKDAGFDVSDRIIVTLQADDTLWEAIHTYETYICEQTLAVSLARESITGETPHQIAEYSVMLKLQQHANHHAA